MRARVEELKGLQVHVGVADSFTLQMFAARNPRPLGNEFEPVPKPTRTRERQKWLQQAASMPFKASACKRRVLCSCKESVLQLCPYSL